MLSNSRTAQSLLEAIIAIGVILVATISATTLIVTTISAGRNSANKVQAANFAREGIEVVRQIRDSNWMKRAQNVCDGTPANCSATPPTATTTRWDDLPFSDGYDPMGTASGKCYFPVYDIASGWFLSYDTPAPCGTTALGAKINKVTDSGRTYLTNQFCPGGVGPTCAPTRFSRIVEIELSTTDTTAGEYLNVVSTVTWNDRGLKSLAMTERLYDWR